ncbi:homeodomain-interacting protein kinase 2-like [Anarhichas minor]|uniref:homeodomain-interacting protein kinase 2-like n=1 Tax=Anarhichas minor TaxID=65739 RepID=UPI003F7367C7
MAIMVLGETLFPGCSEYDTMRCIVELLGVPPDYLLSAGMHSKIHFVKCFVGHWRLKTLQEHHETGHFCNYRAYKFRNLDDLETLPLTNLTEVEADEKMECIDLLKAMLQMDPDDR